MFSRTTEYALRATVLLSQSHGRATATEIAEKTRVPVRYMSKVLQTLSEAGIIESYNKSSRHVMHPNCAGTGTGPRRRLSFRGTSSE